MTDYTWVIPLGILVLSIVSTGGGVIWYLSGRLSVIEAKMATTKDIGRIREQLVALEGRIGHVERELEPRPLRRPATRPPLDFAESQA